MANRQHGRGRSPSGGRTARTVPVSRSPSRSTEAVQPGRPAYTEPEVRRWPHPLEEAAVSPAPEPALHYIRCALSYQNQLLADIKVLLEQLAAGAKETGGIPDQETGGGNLSKL